VIVRGNRSAIAIIRGTRQFGLEYPHLRQQRQQCPRGRALFGVSFEGAVIANNTVDGAAVGVSVCNFNEGGRIAVVQGNIIRTCCQKRPIAQHLTTTPGIASISRRTQSVTARIENAPSFGIIAGWGKYCATSPSRAT